MSKKQEFPRLITYRVEDSHGENGFSTESAWLVGEKVAFVLIGDSFSMLELLPTKEKDLYDFLNCGEPIRLDKDVISRFDEMIHDAVRMSLGNFLGKYPVILNGR